MGNPLFFYFLAEHSAFLEAVCRHMPALIAAWVEPPPRTTAGYPPTLFHVLGQPLRVLLYAQFLGLALQRALTHL